MTLTLELTPEEEAKLREKAQARGVDAVTLLHDLIAEMPAQTDPQNGAEMIAAWRREGVLGEYGDPSLDSLELARRLREQSNHPDRNAARSVIMTFSLT